MSQKRKDAQKMKIIRQKEKRDRVLGTENFLLKARKLIFCEKRKNTTALPPSKRNKKRDMPMHCINSYEQFGIWVEKELLP